MSIKESEIILDMVEQLPILKTTEQHLVIDNVTRKSGVTATISVYNNVKPSHIVLQELIVWAEANNPELKVIIEQIKNDIKDVKLEVI